MVCSARSTGTKSEGTTTRLIQAAREAENGNSKHYEKIVESIREDHNNTAAQCIRSPSILKTLRIGIQSDCQDLLAFLATVSKPEGIRARSLDVIASKGEILSCHLITALLQDYGVDAEFVDLSNIVPLMSQSQDLNQDFYDNLAFLLHEKIQSCGNKIPVVTGFFGIIPGGLLDQIGRGYTDLCGALISVGLSAEEFQVWKEVDGIFTADPRKVPRASLLATISPAEAAELTFYGSEVIHPATMEQLIKARITIRIKNVMNPRGTGTTISPDPVGYLGSADLSHPSQLSRLKRPTAITIKHKILVLNVHSNKRSLSHGFFAKIFSTLDKWRLSIDLISTSEVHVSMALHSESALTSRDQEDKKRIIDKDLQGAINELRQYGTVDCIDGLAILSLIGKQMKKMVGIAGKMFTILGENKVNIGSSNSQYMYIIFTYIIIVLEMISQGIFSCR